MKQKVNKRLEFNSSKRTKSYFHEKRFNNLIIQINKLNFGKAKNKGIIDLEPNFRIEVYL